MNASDPVQSDEIRELLETIRADREAAKQKERGERWTRYVSLTIVALAVLASMASLQAGRFSGASSSAQAQSADQWSFFQAKSIKRHLAEAEARAAAGVEREKLQADVERYAKEGAAIQGKAEELEKARDAASRHAAPLGSAIAVLQVSIAIASVCLITKKKALWAAAGVLGALGTGFLVYGVWLV